MVEHVIFIWKATGYTQCALLGLEVEIKCLGKGRGIQGTESGVKRALRHTNWALALSALKA